MTEMRAPHLRLVVSEPAPAPVRTPRIRFKPVVRLEDGAAFGVHAESEFSFEDTFHPRHLTQTELPTAGGWLGEQIERIAQLAEKTGATLRPISLLAPMAALSDPDAPMAAEAGAIRAGVLPQEFRIDFPDAAVSALDDLAWDQLDAYRRRGFRIGLDARQSWRTPMSSRARMTFEAVRFDLSRFNLLEVPMSRLEVASAEGVALIAENAWWRDAQELAAMGVSFAVAPKTDC
ncbi:MAG: hypothetical protein R3C52_02900 [Hyphomonadaceae bacterium]